MRPLNIFISAALAISMALSLMGCSEDSGTNPIDTGPQPGGSNSAAIGPLGGNVSYGNVVIVFPAGAVGTGQIVQLGIPETEPAYSLPDSLTKIGYLFEATPANLPLILPVSVAFLYDDSALDSLAETTLLLWSLDADSSTLTPLPDVYIDAAENAITGSSEQLGYFLLTVAMDALLNAPPEAPELIAPYDGMPGNALSVTLRWEEVAVADYDHVQVAEDADFLNLHYDGLGITGENIGISGLGLNTIYYWRVRGHNEHGYGTWSQVWSFSTGGGGYPQTIEGSWELIGGEFFPDDMMDGYYHVKIWGEVIVSLGEGGFDIEGERWIYQAHYYDGEVHFEETNSDYLDEEDSYSLTDSTITLEAALFGAPYVYPTLEKGYIIESDTLSITIAFIPGWGLQNFPALTFRRI